MCTRARKLFLLVFKRTWQVFVTMLGAASLALVRRQLPGAPCLVIDDAELCEIPRPRLEEAWLILKAGWNEAKRVAAEGVEAIRLELKFTSAVVGQPGMVTLQYMVDRLTPLRFSALMEEALRESLHSMLDDPLINMRLQKLELRRRHFRAEAVEELNADGRWIGKHRGRIARCRVGKDELVEPPDDVAELGLGAALEARCSPPYNAL